MCVPTIVRLAHGGLSLDLCPALGGAVANFRLNHPAGGTVDLLRPTSAASLAKGDIEAVACFPLTPFSNRLRGGRFTFQGREITLPLNTTALMSSMAMAGNARGKPPRSRREAPSSAWLTSQTPGPSTT